MIDENWQDSDAGVFELILSPSDYEMLDAAESESPTMRILLRDNLPNVLLFTRFSNLILDQSTAVVSSEGRQSSESEKPRCCSKYKTGRYIIKFRLNQVLG